LVLDLESDFVEVEVEVEVHVHVHVAAEAVQYLSSACTLPPPSRLAPFRNASSTRKE
jgi:hypothetical protein